MPNNPNDKNNNNQNNYTQNVSPKLEQELGNQQDSTRNANAPAPGSTINYEDISGDKQRYTPNSQGLSNTGSGAEAALGTDYTWNKQGSSQAQRTYSTEVLTAKQNVLNNRQTIENNAANYQAQADMMKYQNNQNAEKVGWTGGYVLDQNRQMEYLKASIQAQMYGAMELQKYGYDSSLAAARLSYDLNQQEYARQYYQEAVSAALSEAQLTGTYFSAETKDMMSQLAVAQQKENDPNLSDEERAQATKIRESIYNWFSSNGISTEGVKTLEAWQQDQANELQWSQDLWARYDAAIKAANTNISENPSEFIMLDKNGKEMWDGVNVTTGNWETMDKESILNYTIGAELNSEGNAVINQAAMNQYYSYLDSTLAGQIESGFTKWCQTKGYITTDENGNVTIKNKIDNLLERYLKESSIVDSVFKGYDDLINKYNDPKTSEQEKKRLLAFQKQIESWDFEIELPDGTRQSFTYKELKEGKEKETNTSADVSSSGNVTVIDPETGQPVEQTYNYTKGSLSTFDKVGYNGNDYYKFHMSADEYFKASGMDPSSYEALKQQNPNGINICFTTAKVTKVDDPNEKNIDQDDIAISIYEGEDYGTGAGSGYGMEVRNKSSRGNDSADIPLTLFNNLYKASTGNQLSGGEIIVIRGEACFVNTKNGGPYKNCPEGLYGIQVQDGCGTTGKGVKDELKSTGQWVD